MYSSEDDGESVQGGKLLTKYNNDDYAVRSYVPLKVDKMEVSVNN